ncbi:MAG: hypothetical protein ABW298_04090 [Candidatus Binatia bacterium]|jgi:hypothetical protein
MMLARSVRRARAAGFVAAASIGAVLAVGCRVSLWSWSSESGTHELSVPPRGEATPEPTPQAVPTFESRY